MPDLWRPREWNPRWRIDVRSGWRQRARPRGVVAARLLRVQSPRSLVRRTDAHAGPHTGREAPLARGRVYFDADGRPARYEGITQSIDARKQAEMEIAALNERLTLGIQGIHHRLKNNLQFVLTMVGLSTRGRDGAQALAPIASAYSRASSHARIASCRSCCARS
ncbi:MAG: hypothetical protein IT208_03845 [Chthonomonadales bacterium]|nr:hypothetical protein [Chthonomonadales bacterium]